jgi:hypothetical protein
MLSQMMRQKRKIREMIWRWLRAKLVRARVGSQGSAGINRRPVAPSDRNSEIGVKGFYTHRPR